MWALHPMPPFTLSSRDPLLCESSIGCCSNQGYICITLLQLRYKPVVRFNSARWKNIQLQDSASTETKSNYFPCVRARYRRETARDSVLEWPTSSIARYLAGFTGRKWLICSPTWARKTQPTCKYLTCHLYTHKRTGQTRRVHRTCALLAAWHLLSGNLGSHSPVVQSCTRALISCRDK